MDINKIKNIASVIILPAALLLGGCSIGDLFGSNTAELPPVGIYKTLDNGDTWSTANKILSTEGSPTLNAINVNSLILDPNDRQTLYLGSTAHGLFYTYDSAAQWWQSGPIRSGSISAIAVVPKPEDKCTLYLATANRIFKTEDCGRFWDQQYYDTRLKEKILTLVVDSSNTNVIYAGLTTGDVLVSSDAGKNWKTLSRLPGDVETLAQHNLDADTFYAVVQNQGIWKSVDSGVTWENMSKEWREYKDAVKVSDIAVDVNRPDTFIVASSYGLLRTTDGGETWESVSLLTKPNEAKIYSIAIDPQDTRKIYYTTDSTLYRSSDAGQTWETRALPVSGALTEILVDPKLSNVLYMGVNRPVQQNTFGF